jgi:hypothetical protein
MGFARPICFPVLFYLTHVECQGFMSRTIRIGLAILIVSLAVQKCTIGDFYGRLPNGYKFVEASSRNVVIYPSGSYSELGRVSGAIVRMNIYGEYVVGKIDRYPSQGTFPPSATSSGYFILNTKTRTSQTALTEQQWLEKLKALGISPTLQNPASFADELLPITIFKFFVMLLLLKITLFPRVE